MTVPTFNCPSSSTRKAPESGSSNRHDSVSPSASVAANADPTAVSAAVFSATLNCRVAAPVITGAELFAVGAAVRAVLRADHSLEPSALTACTCTSYSVSANSPVSVIDSSGPASAYSHGLSCSPSAFTGR